MKIGVIGAGAAGLIAGAFAAKGGASVDIIDRNEKTGKKLFLTGKGRCNITNSADIDAFLKNVPHNGRFLYSAFDGFFNDDIIELINSCGVRTKLERGGRYFPESDKSSDVIRALQTNAVRCGANIVLNSRVSSVSKTEDGGLFSGAYARRTTFLSESPIKSPTHASFATSGMSRMQCAICFRKGLSMWFCMLRVLMPKSRWIT